VWRQHLFSARARNLQGDVDEFHVLTSETQRDYQFTEQVLMRKGRYQERKVIFIQDCGDSFYIGMDGKVPDVLGQTFPYAYEQTITREGPKQGREITFVHGYFAQKGISIPDLDELLQQQPKHLKEILERANAGESPVAAGKVSFTQQRKKNTDWDSIATEFEKGNFRLQGMTFTIDGKKFLPLESLERKIGHENSQSSAAKISKKKASSLRPTQEELFNPTSSNQINSFQVARIGLLITLLGIGAYLIFFRG
jgi:hypothetical protein